MINYKINSLYDIRCCKMNFVLLNVEGQGMRNNSLRVYRLWRITVVTCHTDFFFFNIKRQTLFKYFVFLLYTQPDYLSKLKELLWTRVEWHLTLLCQPCASRWSACRQYHHSYPTTLSPILDMRTSRSILCFCITTTMLRP